MARSLSAIVPERIEPWKSNKILDEVWNAINWNITVPLKRVIWFKLR